MKPRAFVLLVAAALGGPLDAQYPYGAGSAGASGVVPFLTATQAWLGNGAFGLEVRSGLGGAPAIFALSTAPASVPVAGVEVLVGIAPPELLILQAQVLGGTAGAPGAGTGFFPLPLAPAPSTSLAGLLAYAQVGIADGVLATTNGLMIELTLPPLLAIGSAVSGASYHDLVDPLSGAVVASDTVPGNLTGIFFGGGGQDLFTCSTTGLRHAPAAAPLAWNVIEGSSWLGAHLDRRRKLIYGFVQPSSGIAQLVAVDADPASASFGQPVGSGAPFALGPFSPFDSGLDAHGRRAVILGGNGQIAVFDTDPASATWLQPIQAASIPGAIASVFAIAKVLVAADGRTALVAWAQPFGASNDSIFRYDLEAGALIDFNAGLPGIQPLGPQSVPPVTPTASFGRFDLSRDGTKLAILPQGASDALGLVTFDPAVPSAFTFATIPAPALSPATTDGLALAPDQATLAALDIYGMLRFFDVASGALILGPIGPLGAVNLIGLAYR